MRTEKELILATLPYAKEDRSKSWYYVITTISLLLVAFVGTFAPVHWSLQLISSVLCGLLMVKFFILYHDYNHYAILKDSTAGKIVMTVFGVFILAPITIWKRTHDYHHFHNSKLSNNGVGSYPLLAREDFLKLSKKDRFMYLAARHPLTIFFGYVTLFVVDFNVKSFVLSPRKHWDSFVTVFIHVSIAIFIYQVGGLYMLTVTWIFPFVLSNGLGTYLFYAQHNFPGAIYVENKDWNYTNAALKSTSFLKTNPVMNWFTGNIGYHHVHHLNHQIPFYNLPDAMAAIPELQSPLVTTFDIRDIIACLKLKVWDPQKGEMAAL